jgi:hypothetical protein
MTNPIFTSDEFSDFAFAGKVEPDFSGLDSAADILRDAAICVLPLLGDANYQKAGKGARLNQARPDHELAACKWMKSEAIAAGSSRPPAGCRKCDENTRVFRSYFQRPNGCKLGT